MIGFERYRIILRHELVGLDGHTHKMEDPIVIDRVVPFDERAGASVIINEMLNRFKHDILERIDLNGGVRK